MKSLLIWLASAAMIHAGVLTFPETTKEVKVALDAAVLDVDFPFSNQSGQPVVISKVEGSCTCMTVQIKGDKKRYEPGESGSISATFDLKNQTGDVERLTHLWLQDDPAGNPSVKLMVKFHIPELVKPEPRTVRWDVGAKPEPKVIRVVMSGNEPIRVLKVTSSSTSKFKYELKPVTEGKEYELVVTPDSTEQPTLAVFRLETDCKIESQRTKQVFATVMKPTAPAKP